MEESVVKIILPRTDAEPKGPDFQSGFFLNTRGNILTVAHGLHHRRLSIGDSVEVLMPNSKGPLLFKIMEIRYDPQHSKLDFAILEPLRAVDDYNLKPLKISKSTPKERQEGILFGYSSQTDLENFPSRTPVKFSGPTFYAKGYNQLFPEHAFVLSGQSGGPVTAFFSNSCQIVISICTVQHSTGRAYGQSINLIIRNSRYLKHLISDEIRIPYNLNRVIKKTLEGQTVREKNRHRFALIADDITNQEVEYRNLLNEFCDFLDRLVSQVESNSIHIPWCANTLGYDYHFLKRPIAENQTLDHFISDSQTLRNSTSYLRFVVDLGGFITFADQETGYLCISYFGPEQVSGFNTSHRLNSYSKTETLDFIRRAIEDYILDSTIYYNLDRSVHSPFRSDEMYRLFMNKKADFARTCKYNEKPLLYYGQPIPEDWSNISFAGCCRKTFRAEINYTKLRTIWEDFIRTEIFTTFGQDFPPECGFLYDELVDHLLSIPKMGGQLSVKRIQTLLNDATRLGSTDNICAVVFNPKSLMKDPLNQFAKSIFKQNPRKFRVAIVSLYKGWELLEHGDKFHVIFFKIKNKQKAGDE